MGNLGGDVHDAITWTNGLPWPFPPLLNLLVELCAIHGVTVGAEPASDGRWLHNLSAHRLVDRQYMCAGTPVHVESVMGR